MSNHRVVILGKSLMSGAADIGLAPLLGAERAQGVSQAFLRDTVFDLHSRGYRPIIACDADAPALQLGDAVVEHWTLAGGDVGQRLQEVLTRATADGSIAIAIGADTPGMPDGLIEGAIRRLQDASADAVVGPSHDGGVYLLGVRHAPSGLFDGLSWSAHDTCESLVLRLKQHNLRTALLERWFDVDEPDDLYRLVDLLQRGVVRAPHTAEALGFGGGF